MYYEIEVFPSIQNLLSFSFRDWKPYLQLIKFILNGNVFNKYKYKDITLVVNTCTSINSESVMNNVTVWKLDL